MTPFHLSAAFVERLGWVLVHSVWQFAFIALAALVLQRVMQRASSATRYWVLLLALVTMIVAPVATWLAIPHEGQDAEVSATSSEDAARPGQADVAGTAESDQDSAPLAQSMPGVVKPPAAALKKTTAAATPVESSRPDEQTPTANAYSFAAWWSWIEQGLRPWLNALVIAWCVGVILFAMRPILSWYRVRRLRTVGVSATPDGVQQLLERTAERFRLRQAVRVLQSTLVETAVVVGYFRPVILLPVSVVTGLSPAQLEAILAHELAHVRRHDYLVNLLQTLVETVFFYHPAVWWLSNQVRNERENCCDDIAIAVLGDRVEYGRALLALEEHRGAETALALGAQGGSLLARVRRLLGRVPPQRAFSGRSIAAIGLLAAVTIAIGVWAANGLGEADAGVLKRETEAKSPDEEEQPAIGKSGEDSDDKADEASAVKAVENRGGKVTRDDKLPGKPVIGVNLGGLAPGKVTDAGLKELKALKQLTSLNLYGANVTGADLKELKDLKQLTTLNLYQTQVTDAGLKELADLRQLTSLDLGGNKVTDAGLKELTDLKQLTALKLSNTQVTDAGLKELKALQQLTTLDLSGNIEVTDAGLKELKNLKQLTSLNLRNSGPGAPRVTAAGLKELKDLKQLTSLNLDSTGVTDAGLKELKELKQLTSLNLYANQVTDAGLKELKDLRQLASLNLGGTGVTDAGLKELKDLKQLTSLNLAFAQVTDAGLKELKDLKQLTSLDLNATQVTDAGLKELKELKQLTSLNLTDTKVTDAGLKELKHLKQLTTLAVTGNKVTDAGLKELKDLKQLTTLGLYCTGVTDAGLKELKHLEQLTSLTLAWTKVTDAGLKELKDLKQLTTLHLAFTQVTDAGLKELKDLKRLTDLNLIHTKVTNDGMADLQKALPGLKIGL